MDHVNDTCGTSHDFGRRSIHERLLQVSLSSRYFNRGDTLQLDAHLKVYVVLVRGSAYIFFCCLHETKIALSPYGRT